MILKVVMRGGAKTKNRGSVFCVLKIILNSDTEWVKFMLRAIKEKGGMTGEEWHFKIWFAAYMIILGYRTIQKL